MPRGDGTGPAGMGPMTGRAAGYCAGYPVPGFMNPVGGRGYGGRGRGFRGGGFGRGRGFGWAGAGYGYPMASEQEITGLKQEAEYLQNALSEIKKRIEELDSQKTSKD